MRRSTQHSAFSTQLLLCLLSITILFRTVDADPGTGQAILEPVLPATVRVQQLSGPTAAKGEALACEIINHPATPAMTSVVDEPMQASAQPAWTEFKCKNGARYQLGPLRFTGRP